MLLPAWFAFTTVHGGDVDMSTKADGEDAALSKKLRRLT